MPELSVEITGKMDKLGKALSDSEKSLKGFESKSNSIGKKINKSTSVASKGFTKMNKSVANGSAAMTSFSRTIQDAPFGLMGVSNNITNLTEQFGYLKSKTGSAGGALKAMLRDLKGFGGITLLISVATSAMLMFGDKLFATKNKAKQLRDEQEKLTKSLDDYVFGLEAVNKAKIKGTQNAQKELVSLSLLSSQINNTNLSLNKRKGAIEDLRKKYPEYLQNMSDEKLLNGGLATVYDTLTTSILNRAKATASMNQMIENETKLITLRDKLVSVNTKLKEDEKAIRSKTYYNAATGVAQKQLDIDNARVNANKEIQKITGQIQNLELSNIDLEANVTGLGGIAKSIIPDSKVLRPKVESLFSELSPLLSSNLETLNTSITPVDITPIIDNNKFTNDVSKMLETTQLVSNGIQSMGNVIASSLGRTNGFVGAFFGSMIQSMFQYLAKEVVFTKSKVALDAVKAKSNAVVSATETAAKTPFGAFVLPALIAGATAAVGSALSGLGSIGSGGSNVSGSTDTFNGSSGGFSQSFGGGDNGGNRVIELIARGDQLYAALNTYNLRQTNLGG